MQVVAVFVHGSPGACLVRSFEQCRDEIQRVAAEILNISGEDVNVFFPSDRLSSGAGHGVVVKIGELSELPGRTTPHFAWLIRSCGKAVKSALQVEKVVQCQIDGMPLIWNSMSEEGELNGFRFSREGTLYTSVEMTTETAQRFSLSDVKRFFLGQMLKSLGRNKPNGAIGTVVYISPAQDPTHGFDLHVCWTDKGKGITMEDLRDIQPL